MLSRWQVAIMSRRKVDNRIRVLIENGVALRYRTMFVIVGDKGRDQASRIAVYILWRIK